MTADRAYRLGYDCGYHGPNLTNTSYLIFDTEENTREWERGKVDGRAIRDAEIDATSAFVVSVIDLLQDKEAPLPPNTFAKPDENGGSV